MLFKVYKITDERIRQLQLSIILFSYKNIVSSQSERASYVGYFTHINLANFLNIRSPTTIKNLFTFTWNKIITLCRIIYVFFILTFWFCCRCRALSLSVGSFARRVFSWSFTQNSVKASMFSFKNCYGA